MSSDERKRTVQEGLDRRKKARNERDAALEEQARRLRKTINSNHTSRTLTDAQKQANAKAERQARAKARREKENAAILACHYYIRSLAATVLVTILSPFPWWAAVTLFAALALFTAAYIFRIYYPVGR